MEALVEGPEQLSFRLRRNIALLNGETKDECIRIEKIVKEIYGIRSQLVHGSKRFEDAQAEKYLPYLRQLVASTIIELIQQKIPSLSDLNRKINESGFGQKGQLFEGYNSIFAERFVKLTTVLE